MQKYFSLHRNTRSVVHTPFHNILHQTSVSRRTDAEEFKIESSFSSNGYGDIWNIFHTVLLWYGSCINKKQYIIFEIALQLLFESFHLIINSLLTFSYSYAWHNYLYLQLYKSSMEYNDINKHQDKEEQKLFLSYLWTPYTYFLSSAKARDKNGICSMVSTSKEEKYQLAQWDDEKL